MGGYIGWQFWKYHRDRLKRLIACDTRAAADQESVARGRRISAEMVRQNGTAQVAAQMIPKLFHAENLQLRFAEVEAVRQMVVTSNPETLAQAQLAMAERPDATSWLKEIRVPTLFVVGEHDQITTVSEMRENASQVGNAQLVEISNAGHLPPLENPGEFNQALLKFLGME